MSTVMQPASSELQMPPSSHSNHSATSSRSANANPDASIAEPQSSQSSIRSANGITERQSNGGSHEYLANHRQLKTVETDPSLDGERVAKMVEGIEVVKAKFNDVLNHLYKILREPDVDRHKLQPLCTEWTELQRAFSKITQDSNRMATRGAQAIKEFSNHCDLMISTDCPFEQKINELRNFKKKLESDDNLFGARGAAMYDIDSAFNDLRREVQSFGFKLLAVRDPISEDLLAQIKSLEDDIIKISQEVKGLKKRVSERGGGIVVVLSMFLRVNLQQLMESKEETTDNLEHSDAAELHKKREELEEALRKKNDVEKKWASVSCSCSEWIQQISEQLGAISDIWMGLSSDVLMLEEQLNGNVRNGIDPHLFEIKLQTTKEMYERLYKALDKYTHPTPKLADIPAENGSPNVQSDQPPVTPNLGRRKASNNRPFGTTADLPPSQVSVPAKQYNATAAIPSQPVNHDAEKVRNTPLNLVQPPKPVEYPPKPGKALAPSIQNSQHFPAVAGDQPTRTSVWKAIFRVICPCLCND